MLHAGILGGLTSENSTLVPYASLNLGILLRNDDVMLIGGLGLDYYSAPSVVIFAEAMPTFNVMSGTFYWLPLRLGLKLGL